MEYTGGTFIVSPTQLVGVIAVKGAVAVEDAFIVESLLTTRFNGAFAVTELLSRTHRHPVGDTKGEARGEGEGGSSRNDGVVERQERVNVRDLPI